MLRDKKKEREKEPMKLRRKSQEGKARTFRAQPFKKAGSLTVGERSPLEHHTLLGKLKRNRGSKSEGAWDERGHAVRQKTVLLL